MRTRPLILTTLILAFCAITSCNKLNGNADNPEEFIFGKAELVRDMPDGLYKNGELVIPANAALYYNINPGVADGHFDKGSDCYVSFGYAFSMKWNTKSGVFEIESFNPKWYQYLLNHQEEIIIPHGIPLEEIRNNPKLWTLDHLYVKNMTGYDLSTASDKTPGLMGLKFNVFKKLGPVDLRIQMDNGTVYEFIYRGEYEYDPTYEGLAW